MGKKEFDKNIKEKLEGLHINYDDASWDSFEQKLDNAMSQAEIDDLEFDQVIKDKVQDNISFDFEEEHWQELSTRIDHDNELANRIYLFKIIELVILVLLAYSFFQIEPIKNPTKNLPLYAHSEIFKSIDANKMLEKAVAANVVVQDNLVKTNALSSLILTRRNSDLDLKLAYIENAPIASVSYDILDFPGISSAAFLDQVESSTTNNTDKIEGLFDDNYTTEGHEIVSIDALLADNGNAITIPSIDKNRSDKWLSFSTSADINLVNTPTTFVINGRDNLLETAGASGMIGYHMKSGKNELEVGLGYSYKNYDPNLVDVFDIDSNGTEDYSLFRTSLNRIAFHIAQVPFNYSRYFVDNRKWSAFATLGFTQNFILYSDYSLTDELLSGLAKPWTYKKANSYLLRRTYYTGLFQDIEREQTIQKRSSSKNAPSEEFRTEGNIFDNTFITSYTGVGIQRNFGHNRSLFLKAGYHHQFFGDKLGPNNDQINTFSFTFGGKYRI